jgi:hypothetical protein
MSDVEKVISNLAYKVAEMVKQSINDARSHDDSQGSALAGSVKVKLINTGNSVGFSILANEYWDYFNSGVDGTKTKRAVKNKLGGRYAFKGKGINTEWVKDKVTLKKIDKSKGANRYESALKSARFLIGRSMALHGIKPHPFLDDVLTDANKKEWNRQMTEAFKKEMTIIFK